MKSDTTALLLFLIRKTRVRDRDEVIAVGKAVVLAMPKP
jgi:hypothetical protein